MGIKSLDLCCICLDELEGRNLLLFHASICFACGSNCLVTWKKIGSTKKIKERSHKLNRGHENQQPFLISPICFVIFLTLMIKIFSDQKKTLPPLAIVTINPKNVIQFIVIMIVLLKLKIYYSNLSFKIFKRN